MHKLIRMSEDISSLILSILFGIAISLTFLWRSKSCVTSCGWEVEEKFIEIFQTQLGPTICSNIANWSREIFHFLIRLKTCLSSFLSLCSLLSVPFSLFPSLFVHPQPVSILSFPLDPHPPFTSLYLSLIWDSRDEPSHLPASIKPRKEKR